MKKKEERDDPEVSRRDYIKSAGVAAVGALAGAAVGAAGIHAALPPTIVEKEVVKTVEVEKPVIVEKEVEVKPWIPEKWDEEHEIVVVGSGFAGLAAAIEAYDAGVKDVVVLEKMPSPGGNSIINGGQYGALSPEYGDSVETYINDMLKASIDATGRPYNHVELAEKLARESRDGLEWLTKLGVEWQESVVQVGGQSVRRTWQTVHTSGRDIVEKQLEALSNRGIPLKLNHKVTRIIREKPIEGKVLGVEVETEGEKIYIRARRALVLASGGFASDVEFRKRHCPMLDESLACTNHPGATSEVLIAASQIGAHLIHLSFIQLLPFGSPRTGKLLYPLTPALAAFRGAAYVIYVDHEGKRWVNELAPRDVVSNAMLREVKTPPYWVVWDDASWPKFGLTKEQLEKDIAEGWVYKADTIEDLARKIGVPPENLVETVNRYNEFVEKGVDEEFGKPMLAAKIEKSPFYAADQWCFVHHCMGGIEINTRAQVLDANGNPIPKWYAAGEATGGVHGGCRIGSHAIPDCIVFGRTAGKEAVKERLD